MGDKASLGNMSFSLAHEGLNSGSPNNSNNGYVEGEVHSNGGMSPTSPSIAIPEKIYNATEQAVFYKLIDYIYKSKTKQDLPHFEPSEKNLLKYLSQWDRQFPNKVRNALGGVFSVMPHQENANITKFVNNATKRARSRRRHRKQRKTRKA